MTIPTPRPNALPLWESARARKHDPDTSKAAAGAITGSLGKIQRLVLHTFRLHGPMSARQAERREEFYDYGFSTIRKRISELAQAGLLVADGTETKGRCPATVYRVASDIDWGSL